VLTTSFAPSTGVGSGPIRRSFAQWTTSSTRSARSAGSSRCSSDRSRKLYSPGVGAVPDRYMTTSLPIASSASAIASIEPTASPSGFSCAATTKRSFDRIASATARTSVVVLVWLIVFGKTVHGKVCGDLVDQLCHADAPLDGVIVGERERGRPAQAQFAVDLRLQDAAGGIEPRQRRAPLLLAPENRDEDPSFAEIRRNDRAGDRHHADAWILQVAKAFRDDGADGFVHSAHALGHARSLVVG